MEINISQLLDERNNELWAEINRRYSVDVKRSNDDGYGCFTQNNTCILYIPDNNYCIDSFTHELLHAYLKAKGIYTGACVINFIRSSNTMSRIFSEPLLDHVNNCLDHIVMYPIYIKLGFSQEKFILDYYTVKCDKEELNTIARFYKYGKNHSIRVIDAFIGRFFSVVADPNKSIDYSECLDKLEKIDSVLFLNLRRLTSEVQNSPIEDLPNCHLDIVSRFYNSMKGWITGKSFE